MISAGVPRADAMKITGHITESMFTRYNIRQDDDVRRALERTQAYRKTVAANIITIDATAG